MRDGDIRAALDSYLRRTHATETGTLIRHEVGVCAGRRRIDVAVLNGEIAGYEIKSDEDTLSRLADQAEAYAQVLDRVVLVTTGRHLVKAINRLPSWWGVIAASEEDGRVVLEPVRLAAVNSAHDRFALAQLLWRDEALRELRARGLGRGLSAKARHYVWGALAAALSVDELRDLARQTLKERPEWPGGLLRVRDDATFRMPASTSLSQPPL